MKMKSCFFSSCPSVESRFSLPCAWNGAASIRDIHFLLILNTTPEPPALGPVSFSNNWKNFSFFRAALFSTFHNKSEITPCPSWKAPDQSFFSYFFFHIFEIIDWCMHAFYHWHIKRLWFRAFCSLCGVYMFSWHLLESPASFHCPKTCLWDAFFSVSVSVGVNVCHYVAFSNWRLTHPVTARKGSSRPLWRSVQESDDMKMDEWRLMVNGYSISEQQCFWAASKPRSKHISCLEEPQMKRLCRK